MRGGHGVTGGKGMPSHSDWAGGDPVVRAGNWPVAPACRVCDSRSCNDFLTHEGIGLLSCADCGTVFMHPLPTVGEVTGIYDDSYDGASTGYFAPVEKKMRRSRRRTASTSIRAVSGGSWSATGCGWFVAGSPSSRGTS